MTALTGNTRVRLTVTIAIPLVDERYDWFAAQLREGDFKISEVAHRAGRSIPDAIAAAQILFDEDYLEEVW